MVARSPLYERACARLYARLFEDSRRWRLSYARISRTGVLPTMQRMADFGHDMARCLATQDEALFEELYARDSALWRRVVEAVENEWVAARVTECDHCGKFVLMAKTFDVRDEGQWVSWCHDCVEVSATECCDCNELHPTYNTHDVSGYGRVCDSCFQNGDYFVCASCGGVYHEDDYGGEGMCHDCYDESEADSCEDGLDDYHHGDRDWIVLNKHKHEPFRNAPPLGLEIEVYASDRASAVAALRDFSDSDDYPSPLLLERDASLSDAYGFEIITHPMGLTEHHKHTAALLDLLHEQDVRAWQASDGIYGIHISVHRSYLSPLQEARMMLFLAASENSEFVTAIAQRNGIYSPTLNIGGLPSDVQRIREVSSAGMLYRDYHGRVRRKITGVGKYAPINFKDNLAEFRIFQSTLNRESFFKNIEFVYALIEWTRPESATGSHWHYQDFLKWLVERPGGRKTYPHLFGYLSRETFPVKVYGSRPPSKHVQNEWRDLFVKH